MEDTIYSTDVRIINNHIIGMRKDWSKLLDYSKLDLRPFNNLFIFTGGINDLREGNIIRYGYLRGKE